MLSCTLTTALTAGLAFASQAAGLNIMLNNDDGFGSANIREIYRLLKGDGHNVVIVAPAVQQSGQGGRSVFTDEANLTAPSQYNLVGAGEPSLGQDPIDPGIWYYNGTPAACTFVGFDWVIPNATNMSSVDLVVTGSNFGTNLGPFLYTLSGTFGAAYAAIGRGVPALAVSGGNSEQRSYLEINETTVTGLPDPSTIQAQITLATVRTLISNTPGNSSLLPLGYGLTLNLPEITTLESNDCVSPPLIQTRMTGGATWDIAVRNETTGLFNYEGVVTEAANQCINGYCDLIGETQVVEEGKCAGSLSVFTIDYDAPAGKAQRDVRARLEPLVGYVNATGVEGYGKGHHWPARNAMGERS